MAENEILQPDGRTEHSTVRFEPKDVHLGWIVGLIVVAGCILASEGFVIWRLYWFQAGRQATAKASPYPLAPGPLPAPNPLSIPEPRLEQLNRMAGDERSNVFLRQLARERTLHSYGPATEKGFVHVPVLEAAKILAAEGPSGTLRKRPDAPPQTILGQGLRDAGEPNSGRVFEGALP
jgi:hypothetical protein